MPHFLGRGSSASKANLPHVAGDTRVGRPAGWPKILIVFIFVLSSFLSGCTFDAADDTDSVIPPPLLPEGIRFEDAVALHDTQTRFHAVWDTTAPVQPPTRPSTFDAVTTTLSLPAGVHYAFHTTGTWETDEDIDYRISHDDKVICQAQKVDHPEICMVRWLPASDEDRTLTFELWAYSPHPYRPAAPSPTPDIPVQILLDLRPTGPYGVPQPDWEDEQP